MQLGIDSYYESPCAQNSALNAELQGGEGTFLKKFYTRRQTVFGVLRRRKFSVVILLLLCALFLIGCADVPRATTCSRICNPQITNGVLDLSCRLCWDKKQKIFLRGDADFFWGKFVNSQILESDTSIVPDIKIKIPGVWNHNKIDGESIDATGFATVRIRVILPEDKSGLAMRTKTILSAHKVYLDSEVLTQVGVVSDNRDDFVMRVMPQIIKFPDLTGKDTVDLFFQIANFSDKNAGFIHGAYFGDYTELTKEQIFIIAYQMILFGILLALSFFLILITLKIKEVIPSKIQVLSYVLFNVVVMGRILLTEERLLYFIFPFVSTETFFLFEYLLLYFIFTLTQSCLYYLAPNKYNLIFTRITIGLGVVTSIFTLFIPLSAAGYFIDFWQYYSILMVINITIWIFARRKEIKEGLMIKLVGIAAFMIVGYHDIILNSYGETFITYDLLPFGMLIFSFSNIYVFLCDADEYIDKQKSVLMEESKWHKDLSRNVISIVAELIEHRDKGTGGHIDRTTLYVEMLIGGLIERGIYAEELRKWDIKATMVSARLHDVGKIAVSDTILNKAGKLTDDEFDHMKRHTLYGSEIIAEIAERTGMDDFLINAKFFAEYHHERWDGYGYPHGLKEYEIPLQGRIMSIVDVYDALTSERSYKAAFTHENAVEIIMASKGKQFDPAIADVFFEMQAEFNVMRKNFNGENYAEYE